MHRIANSRMNMVLLWGQTAAIVIWMIIFENPQEETYASFDYLICGVAGLYCLWKNCGRFSKKMAVFPLLFSLSTLLSNYARFAPVLSALNIARMGLTLLGSFLICGHIFSWTENSCAESANASGIRPVRVFFLSMAGILTVYWTYLFFCAYPGYYDADTIASFDDIRDGTYGYRIPVYYTFFIEGCLRVGNVLGKAGNDALAIYSLVQTAAMAACAAYMIVTLHERNVPKRWLLALGIIYAFVPCYLGTSVSIWKDTPFSLAAAALCIALYRIYGKVGNAVGNYAVYALSAAVFCLSRTNGWYSFLALSVLLLSVSCLRNWKLLGICAGVLLTTWVMLNPVLEHIGSRGTDYLEILSTPLQQVARVCWSDYELPAQDVEFLDEVLDTEIVADKYNRMVVDPIKFECFRRENMDYFMEHFGEYAALWLRWGLRYPVEYLKAWVDLTKGFWSIGCNYWNVYAMSREYEPMEFADIEFDNPISSRFQLLFARAEESMLLHPFFSCGLQFWLLLGCMLIQWRAGNKNWVAGIPALIILAGLWLCTPTSGPFRYAYVVAFIVPFMICDVIFRQSVQCEDNFLKKD